MELVNAFRCCLETGIRTNQHPYLKHYVYSTKVPIKKNYQSHTAWHFRTEDCGSVDPLPNSHRTCVFSAKGLVVAEALLAQMTRAVIENITGPARTKSPAAVIFHGLEFGMMPKYIRMQYGDTVQFSIVVQFRRSSLGEFITEVQIPDLIESLFMAECLVFPSYPLLEEFLDLLEKNLIQFNVKSVGLHEMVIISDFKPFYVKVLADKDGGLLGLGEFPDVLQLPVFQGDEAMYNPEKDILESY